ncbi:hypothetical protein GA0061077_1050 [Bifidobacterium commune]|uniref:Uncharacterized protein n=1 Tax=Bifidobacterium commune TaxID=1505727 RepID=A0A1C4H5T8_9BIFI|nr:hypothetical protein GA0061077_1050 [Bifidobacterium commune]
MIEFTRMNEIRSVEDSAQNHANALSQAIDDEQTGPGFDAGATTIAAPRHGSKARSNASTNSTWQPQTSTAAATNSSTPEVSTNISGGNSGKKPKSTKSPSNEIKLNKDFLTTRAVQAISHKVNLETAGHSPHLTHSWMLATI